MGWRLLAFLLWVPAACAQRDRATAGYDALQAKFWDPSAGWWSSSMWWQTANTVEVLCNLGMRQPAVARQLQQRILPAVYAATANSSRGRCDAGVDRTFSGYFDDEEWWGIAWLRAYRLTRNSSYLGRSAAIFDDLVHRAWSDASCGGGVCWQATSRPEEWRAATRMPSQTLYS